ncbi:hypothetical protein [Viridibacillus arvi]|uniref:hypothetical protein n=1 Tax=Viridibacillus arvi TaxID=263475 RepID=UPI003D2E0193
MYWLLAIAALLCLLMVALAVIFGIYRLLKGNKALALKTFASGLVFLLSFYFFRYESNKMVAEENKTAVEEDNDYDYGSYDNDSVVDSEDEDEPDVELTDAEIEEMEREELVYEFENEVQQLIDDNKMHGVEIVRVEYNDHMGTDKDGDFIGLAYLKYNDGQSAKTTKKLIDLYTEEIAANLAESDEDLSELVVFWETPFLLEGTNTAKIQFTRQNDKFVFGDKNYNSSIFN